MPSERIITIYRITTGELLAIVLNGFGAGLALGLSPVETPARWFLLILGIGQFAMLVLVVVYIVKSHRRVNLDTGEES